MNLATTHRTMQAAVKLLPGYVLRSEYYPLLVCREFLTHHFYSEFLLSDEQLLLYVPQLFARGNVRSRLSRPAFLRVLILNCPDHLMACTMRRNYRNPFVSQIQ